MKPLQEGQTGKGGKTTGHAHLRKQNNENKKKSAFGTRTIFGAPAVRRFGP